MGPDAIAAYEQALHESEAAGCRIRAVMICNPHNPLGFCYSREALEAYARFCEKHDLHLVSGGRGCLDRKWKVMRILTFVPLLQISDEI